MTNDRKVQKKIANCQDFTIQMLQKIGVTDLKFENTSIGDYLESVFSKGTTEVLFTTNKEFRDKYNVLFRDHHIQRLIEKKHSFPTHRDLDLFVRDFMQVDSLFEHSEECQLLKAFDRGFWLKYRRCCQQQGGQQQQQQQQEEVVRNEPLMEEDTCEMMCPFGDPQESYSLLVQPSNNRRK